MVDGAIYTVAHDVRGRITTALNLDLTYDNNNRLLMSMEKRGKMNKPVDVTTCSCIPA